MFHLYYKGYIKNFFLDEREKFKLFAQVKHRNLYS